MLQDTNQFFHTLLKPRKQFVVGHCLQDCKTILKVDFVENGFLEMMQRPLIL